MSALKLKYHFKLFTKKYLNSNSTPIDFAVYITVCTGGLIRLPYKIGFDIIKVLSV